MYKDFDNYLFKMKILKERMEKYEKEKLEEDTSLFKNYGN